MSFICIQPQASLDPIDVVQNVYDDLGLTQSVDRAGSEWTRSVTETNILTQDFADFIGESVNTNLSLSSSSSPVAERVVSVSNTFSLIQSNTVAGGRVSSGGGGGGESSSFGVTYDSGGATTEKGLWVYIDSSDGEAKLAAFNSSAAVAEVAGFVDDTYNAGDSATVVAEGVIEKADWSNVAGTTNLTRGASYYLHTGGQMRVTPPETGRVVVLGRAITPTKFDTELDTPVVL